MFGHRRITEGREGHYEVQEDLNHHLGIQLDDRVHAKGHAEMGRIVSSNNAGRGDVELIDG